MKLLVVILCYKVPDLTIDCLRSLEDEVDRVPATKVAVCENGTGGDAADRIADAIVSNGWGSWVDLKVIYPNLGFTGGNNVVIREWLASGDPPEYFLLLNADTIVRPRALQTLVEFMDAHPRVGIAGSQLLWPDGVLQWSPYRFPGAVSEFTRGLSMGLFSRLTARWSTTPPTPSENSPAEWVSGCSMILRRTMLDEIGLLDEGLYTYFDDIDICHRARRAGWESWYVPGSQVIHLEGSSTGVNAAEQKRRPSYWFEARRRCFLKNFGPFRTALIDGAYLAGASIQAVRRWLFRKPDPGPPHFLRDSFRHSVFLSGFAVREVENPALPRPRADVAKV